jgi:hypothetical protein
MKMALQETGAGAVMTTSEGFSAWTEGSHGRKEGAVMTESLLWTINAEGESMKRETYVNKRSMSIISGENVKFANPRFCTPISSSESSADRLVAGTPRRTGNMESENSDSIYVNARGS